MAQTAQSKVVYMTEQTVRFEARLSLSELYAQLDGRELLVEPLSARKPISGFLAEGGLGFGSAAEGSFAASICRVRTEQFEYGSDHQALYNVGYPLQRLVEGAPHALLKNSLRGGSILDLTVYVRPRQERVAVFRRVSAAEIQPPTEADDVFFVNDAAARLLGLEGSGLVALYPKDLAPDEPAAPGVWEKRFIEDSLPPSHAALKALIQPSRLAECAQRAEPLGGVFFALFTHLGVLLLATGEAQALQQVAKEILSAPLTWKLPAGAD